jgi:hypothetical protein
MEEKLQALRPSQAPALCSPLRSALPYVQRRSPGGERTRTCAGKCGTLSTGSIPSAKLPTGQRDRRRCACSAVAMFSCGSLPLMGWSLCLAVNVYMGRAHHASWCRAPTLVCSVSRFLPGLPRNHTEPGACATLRRRTRGCARGVPSVGHGMGLWMTATLRMLQ